MLETIIRSWKRVVLGAGLSLGLYGCDGCGDDTFGNSSRPDVYQQDLGADAQSACTDSDNDNFYAQRDCGTEIDCDDHSNGIFPGALEFCDYVDNNCDGQVDENAGRTVYRDSDNDGFGNRSMTAMSCVDNAKGPKIPELKGYVYNSDDCDDYNNGIYPGAPERCDDIDQDCDGNNYNSFNVGDTCSVGVGECINFGTYRCLPDGSETECDAVSGIPADELCDGLDNNCDNRIDNRLTAPSRECLAGVGECVRPGLEYQVCTGVAGWSSIYLGCDAVPAEPEAELCDELDNDCNGIIDNFTRLVDCPTPIRSSYTQECIAGEWFDVDLDDCPECLDGTTRDDSCCGYDGEGMRTMDCTDGRWVRSGSCSIDDFINVSNNAGIGWSGKDNSPSIDLDDVVFTSYRVGSLPQIHLVNVEGIGARNYNCLSCTLPTPSISADPFGGSEWGTHDCDYSSLSEGKVAFECHWVENDPLEDDDFYNLMYVKNTVNTTVPLLNLQSAYGIFGHTPSISGDHFVFQKVGGTPYYTIESRDSVSGVLEENFGAGLEFPDIDGDYVAFTSTRDTGQRVYLGNTETGVVNLISGAGFGEDGYRPSIQGNDVVFYSLRDGGVRQLFHYDIGTGSLEQLTEDCGANYDPDIYDRKVAFTSERLGTKEVYVCNLAETSDCCADAVNISNNPANDYDPSFSVCKVAYVSDRDGNEEVYVYDLCEGECGG